MAKDWLKKFRALDSAEFDTAVEAFGFRLQEIMASRERSEVELADLKGKLPQLEADAEEALLGSEEDIDKADSALAAIRAAIDETERRIQVIDDTLNRQRPSPGLQALAQTVWDAAAGRREAMVELVDSALKELFKARDDYLLAVSRFGELGRAINHLDNVMNRACSPFMAERRFQEHLTLPQICIREDEALYAYDPNAQIPHGVNPDILTAPPVNGKSALGVLNLNKGDS